MDITTKLNVNLEQLLPLIYDYGSNIIFALLIFLVGKWVSKRVTSLLRRSMKKAKLDEMLVSFLGNIIYVLLLAFVIIAALAKLGIETTSIAAIFAAAGLAIGLALQGSLSNFASGIMIILFRPFHNGDFIELAGTSGVVKEIGVFTTTLKSGDNKTVIIPNSKITSSELTNYSTEKNRRIDLVFGCSYQDDLKKTKKILEDILNSNKRVLKDPEALVAVSELADSSVNFVVRPWVKNEDYWSVKFEITEAVKQAFDKAALK